MSATSPISDLPGFVKAKRLGTSSPRMTDNIVITKTTRAIAILSPASNVGHRVTPDGQVLGDGGPAKRARQYAYQSNPDLHCGKQLIWFVCEVKRDGCIAYQPVAAIGVCAMKRRRSPREQAGHWQGSTRR
jgi:hypothetical protein